MCLFFLVSGFGFALLVGIRNLYTLHIQNKTDDERVQTLTPAEIM